MIDDLEGEVWVDVENYVGLYKVSNLGRLKSLSRDVACRGGGIRVIKTRIVKPSKRLDGYMIVNIFREGKREVFTVHKLIAKMFIPNVDSKSDIDHINNNKEDNRVCNLRWATRLENLNNRKNKKPKGRNKIKCITTGEIFNTLKEAGEKHELKPATIASCCKQYSRTTKSNIIIYERLTWQYI